MSPANAPVTNEKLPAKLDSHKLSTHLWYAPWIYFPLLSGLVWLAGLLAFLGLWIGVDNIKQYERDEATVVFISDVGGAHQTLFIGFVVPTVVLYFAAMVMERWLRHSDRLPSADHTGRRCCNGVSKESIFDIIAVVFAGLGSVALISTASFNPFSHSTAHWTSACIFIFCIAISALFQSLEVWFLHKEHPDRTHLVRNAAVKLVIVIFAICVAVAFAVLYAQCDGSAGPAYPTKCERTTSAAAVCEWFIAFLFAAYLFTLVADLWPASKTSPRYLRRVQKWEQHQHGSSPSSLHGRPSDAEMALNGRRAFAVPGWENGAAEREANQRDATHVV